ncbi:MAG: rod shape-determining protein MreC [Gemmatimonadetes bacterium]|nr:MAG: rod shape-determining protein MreC [Gemmatimonadota bacterium]
MAGYTSENDERSGGAQGYLTALFVLVSIVVLSLPDGAQQRTAAALRATLLRPFVLVQEGIARARVHAATTEALQARLDSLTAIVANQRTLALENEQLRAAVGLGARMRTAYQPASVLRSGTTGSESSFLLDVGAEQGIHVNAPVITQHGLLGVVREVHPRSATGIDWSHPDFRASAMTLDGSVTGFVEARQRVFGDLERLLLDGVPFHQRLEPGTLIVTSGLGGVFPRGVPIGVVDSEAETRAGWLRSYWLRPAVDPTAATHALVALGPEGQPGAVAAAFGVDTLAAGADSVRAGSAARGARRGPRRGAPGGGPGGEERR